MSKSTEKISFSIVVPVYNRPQETEELLSSLLAQSFKDFEVIIVEDGSSVLSEKVVRNYMNRLQIKYFYKENSGPGQSRNYGMQRASGNYFIILDSDVVLPENYMQIVNNRLQNHYVDAYGGPDAAADNFTNIQKAINYAMTSFFTTGGIRGKSNSMEKFHPRSFNMGISKEVFTKTGGFSKMRFGEDIDFSIRIMSEGFTSTLFTEAFVYHKRRNTLKQFFKQVYNSGIARINLYKRHPKSLKVVHFFPALFSIGFLVSFFGIFVSKLLLLPFLLYFIILSFDAYKQYNNLKIALQSAVFSFVMLLGYGLGFIRAFYKRIIRKEPEFASFEKTFYE
jgi:glycosyltransferase involved in cell wall biosynthesis